MALEVLKNTIHSVEDEREYMLRRGLDSRQNQFIGKHITCDNQAIMKLYKN